MSELKEFAYALDVSYVNSFAYSKETKNSSFAFDIALSLQKHKNLLNFVSKLHRKDLDDCLRTHTDKYLRAFENTNRSKDDITKFRAAITEIMDALHTPKSNIGIETSDLDLLGERVYTVVKNAQLLFAEQAHNQKAKDAIQANSIVLSIDHLNYEDQTALMERIVLIKEIWDIENAEDANKDGVKYKFHKNPKLQLKLKGNETIDQVFASIIHLMAERVSVLDKLTDEQLIHLYDRIKNAEWSDPSIPLLLLKIHDESQFRYSYNRLTDSGYELLNRFQSYDAIMHQIKLLEFATLEAYLLHSLSFPNKFLQALSKHIDNLRALNVHKNEDLAQMLRRIDTRIHHMHEQEKEGVKSSLLSVKAKLDQSLEARIQKKYLELDKFTIHALQDRYKKVFENINKLFDQNEEHKEILHNMFIEKVTHDFYLPNLSNSIDKLRKMALLQADVKNQLSQIDLVDIFIGNDLHNKIASFDFKKVAINPNIKSASDYVYAIIKEIITSCSAFQLEILYKPLAKASNLNVLKKHLKDRIIQQIHQRTSITKMMYSIVRGRKKEYDRLKHVKKTIKKNHLSHESDAIQG